MLFGCSRGGPGGLFSNGKVAVSVDKPIVEEKQARIALSATLIPSEKADILFPMDVKIDRVAVNMGDSVNQGDPILYLNEQEFALKLSQIKAQRMEQEALLEKNNYFFKNKDRLLEEGKIDKSLAESLESEVKTIEAGVERLKADIALLESQVRQVVVNAPISGMVTAKNVTNGVEAVAKQTLITIVKPDPIHVSFNLPAADAPAVTKGMNINVKVEDFSNQAFTAPIIFIGPELDPAKKTFEVRAALPNSRSLFKSGMNAQVHFVSPQKVKVLSIPTKAVLNDSNREYVYIVRQNRAWRVRIYTRPNPDNPELTEVMEGLTDADMVVTEGQDKLKEGAEVNLWQ